MLTKTLIKYLNTKIEELENFCLRVNKGIITMQELDDLFYGLKDEIKDKLKQDSDEWRLFDSWSKKYLWKNRYHSGIYATSKNKDKIEDLIDILTKLLKENLSKANFLDKKLIDNVLGVLNNKDKKIIKISFEKGLKEFEESNKDKSKLANAVRDMQLSLDETAKILLKDKNVGFKHLLKDKNWNKIINNKYYQKMFFQLNEFADKLVKHKLTELDKYEVETFIYLTGIFIRLAFVK